MSSTVRGFNIRDLTPHAKTELGHVAVNPGKVLPATATGNLFTVTGIIAVTGLYGFISTVFSATAVHPSLGITGSNSAIAAPSGASYASAAVGGVIIPPTALGGALPAAVAAQSVASAAGVFVLDNTVLTVTTDATNTGAVTWVMTWVPLFPKGSGATVVAN